MDDIDSQIKIFEKDELPFRIPPLQKGQFKTWCDPDAANVAVICAQKVIKAVEDHAKKEQYKEVGGLLLGDAYQHEGVTYIEVAEYITARNQSVQQSSRSSLTFTDKMWNELWKIKDRDFDQLRIVGWFHSHPDHGVFLSPLGDDLAPDGDEPISDEWIHKEYFGRTWQTAMVYDPKRHEGGFFISQRSQIILAPGFFELFDQGRQESIITWRNLLKPTKTKVIELGHRESQPPRWLIPVLFGLFLVISLFFFAITQHSIRQLTDTLHSAMATDAARLDAADVSLDQLARTQATQVIIMSTLQTDLTNLLNTSSLRTPLAPAASTEAAIAATSTPATMSTEVVAPAFTPTPPAWFFLASAPYIEGYEPNPEGTFTVLMADTFAMCVLLVNSTGQSIEMDLWMEFRHQTEDGFDSTEKKTQQQEPGKHKVCFDRDPEELLTISGTWNGHIYYTHSADGIGQMIPMQGKEGLGAQSALIIDVE